jgi:hypothetical protein
MIKKIISGGQTGVDIAALMAAKCLGVETGGYAPRDFRDEWGNRPHYQWLFGMKEIDETRRDRDMSARTRRNVRASDATVVFYGKKSPGSELTIKVASKERKPCLEVALGPLMSNKEPHLKDVWKKRWENWLKIVNPEILNVAGNRESVCPGITIVVFNLMIELLSEQRNVR